MSDIPHPPDAGDGGATARPGRLGASSDDTLLAALAEAAGSVPDAARAAVRDLGELFAGPGIL